MSIAPADDGSKHGAKRKVEASPGAKIVQQYRDRHGMSYELELGGARLTIQFLFPKPEGAAWRVRAAMVGETHPDSEASAPTRELAFTALVEQWGHSPPSRLAGIDWLEVASALRAVRAM